MVFGQTPMSRPGDIRPASAVNRVGNVQGEARPCTPVMHERQVTLEPHAPG